MTTVTEEDIYNVLADLRGYKQELKESQTEKTRLEDEIEGYEDDIKNAENELQRLIKEYTEAGKEIPAW